MTLYTRSKKFHKSKSNPGRVILSTLIIISIISIGFAYIAAANGVVSQGYALRDLKEQLAQLQVDNQKLQIEAARLQFPANLEEIAQEYNMVEVGEVVYLEGQSGVAVIDSLPSN